MEDGSEWRVMSQLEKGQVTQTQAAILLGLSSRQCVRSRGGCLRLRRPCTGPDGYLASSFSSMKPRLHGAPGELRSSPSS